MAETYFKVIKLRIGSRSRIYIDNQLKESLEINSNEVTAFLGENFLIIPRQTKIDSKTDSKISVPTKLPKINREG